MQELLRCPAGREEDVARGAPTGPSRQLPLAGCPNFRDLGGYPAAGGGQVAWRRLYRSGSLARLTYEDHYLFLGLGIKTVLDLRSTAEQQVSDTFGDAAVNYYRLPLTTSAPSDEDPAEWAGPKQVAKRYLRMVLEGAEALAGVVQVLCTPGALPAVVCCSVGKDRAGIVAALVLGFLEVPEEFIVADYALSQEPMSRLRRQLAAEHPVLDEEFRRYGSVFRADPAAISGFLHELRQVFGSPQQLARSLGIDSSIPWLQAALIEP